MNPLGDNKVYDNEGHYIHQKTHQNRYEPLLQLIENLNWTPNPGDMIVDAGCYLGLTCIELAAKYLDLEVFVVGMDLNVRDRVTMSSNIFLRYLDLAGLQYKKNLSNNIGLIDWDFTQMPFEPESLGMIVFGNNISYDIEEKKLDSPENIKKRIGSAFNCLRENGIIVIWGDHFGLPIIILQKIEGKALNMLNHDTYESYLTAVYSTTELSYIFAKIESDCQRAEDIIQALNS